MLNTRLQAVISATITPNAPIDAMLTDAGAAFNSLGICTRVLSHSDSFPNPQLMKALVVALRDSGLSGFIMNINAKDELVIGERDGRPLTIHDAWGIPLVAWMVDHPAVHLQHLLRAPENAIIGVIDEGHLRFLADAGLAPRSHVFCPHGGPDPVPDPLSAAERPVDLLFVGNVDAPGPVADWLDVQSKGNAGMRAALSDAYEAVLSGAEVYGALADSFSRGGLNAHPHALAPMIAAMDIHINQTRRLAVLEAVRDRKVLVLGEVSPPAAARLSHHDLRGAVPFTQALALMAEAKVVINSRCTFSRGAHERVFYALSRGAVVATEHSTFLERDMAEGTGMVALPAAAEDINALLGGLCDNPARLDDLRNAGLATYATRHSWRNRAERLLPLIKQHLS